MWREGNIRISKHYPITATSVISITCANGCKDCGENESLRLKKIPNVLHPVGKFRNHFFEQCSKWCALCCVVEMVWLHVAYTVHGSSGNCSVQLCVRNYVKPRNCYRIFCCIRSLFAPLYWMIQDTGHTMWRRCIQKNTHTHTRLMDCIETGNGTQRQQCDASNEMRKCW